MDSFVNFSLIYSSFKCQTAGACFERESLVYDLLFVVHLLSINLFYFPSPLLLLVTSICVSFLVRKPLLRDTYNWINSLCMFIKANLSFLYQFHFLKFHYSSSTCMGVYRCLYLLASRWGHITTSFIRLVFILLLIFLAVSYACLCFAFL